MDSNFLNGLRERTRALVQKSQNPKKTLDYLRKDFAKRLDLTPSPIQDAPASKVAVMEMKSKGKAVMPAAECCKGQRRDGGKQVRGGHALSWRPRGIVPPLLQSPSKSFIREAGRRAGCVPCSVARGGTGKKEMLGKSQNSEADGCWSSDELGPKFGSHWNPLFTISQFDPGGPSNNVTADQLTEMNSPVRVSSTSGPNSGHGSSWHHAGGRGVGTGMKPLAGQRNKETLTALNRKQVKEYRPKKMQLHTESVEPNSRTLFHESGNGASAPVNSLKMDIKGRGHCNEFQGVPPCFDIKQFSLCARVLKGRYYPHSGFWNAQQPRSASAMWRSILAGCDLLKCGAQWGIGDGKQVHILSDHWIPSIPPDILQPIFPIPSTAKVHCLLDEDSGTWNEETVRAFFRDDVASAILCIPISRRREDFVRWPFTRFGEYSVRSAYNLARSNKFLVCQCKKGQGQSSNRSIEEKQWKALWTVKAPNKMKVVLWRFAQDCLPTGAQLLRRQVPSSELCYFCGRLESVEHALLFCPHAREIWKLIKEAYDINLRRYAFISPKLWLFDFFSRSSDLGCTVLTVTIWHIWEARNFARNNPEATHPRHSAEKIKAYVHMIQQHLYQPVSLLTGVYPTTRGWFGRRRRQVLLSLTLMLPFSLR